MPSRAKKLDRAVAKLPSIPKELVAQFLSRMNRNQKGRSIAIQRHDR